MLQSFKTRKGCSMAAVIKTIKLIIFTVLCLFWTACTSKYIQPSHLEDTKKYKQDANAYLKNIPLISYHDQLLFDQTFNKKYFLPWHIEKLDLSLKEATWGHGYKNKIMYGDNHKQLTHEWFDIQINNSNFQAYNQKLQKAITTQNSNLRVFPTDSKMFYNPKNPGEGFPFDYNQNSGIKINSPLLISHFSKDKAWAYVQASFATGWIKIKHIAFVNNELAKKFESGNYYIAIKDNFAIYKNDIFKEYIKLGTLFPKTKSGKYLTIDKGNNLNGYLSTIKLTEMQIDKKPIKLNAYNVKNVFNQLLEEPYGWGEILSHRDCSALTRDFLAPFGIYLGRNSATQSKEGQYHDLKDFTHTDKKAFIIKNGIPFLTLIYLKGHIMLYIGHDNTEPLVFHNVWGVKTLKNNKHGRFIIGRSVVTSLEPGKELRFFDEEKSILNQVLGISNIIQKK